MSIVLLGVVLILAFGFVWTVVETRRVESRYAPTGEFIDVEGTRLHYIDRGHGRPVVLIHGNAGFVQDWSAVVPALTEEYRVLALDRPGHGASSRPSARDVTPDAQAQLIHAALERLQVKCPLLVGFSWGGGLSLIYALRYPQESCGLVLIAPRAFPDEATRSFAYRVGRTPILGDVFRYTVMVPMARRIIRRRLTAGYAPDSPVEKHLLTAIDLWSRPGQAAATVWDSQNLGEALHSYSQRYQQISMPALILVGAHDSPERESVPLSKQIPNAQLTVLPDTGHLIPQVRPEAVIEAVKVVSAELAR
jgi:pimeloyl-ACP methyl ester carboxylesterase